MTGGLVQLAAVGIEDQYIIRDPQITYFKVIYRRHTNFSIESIRQNFIHTPDFGNRVTCIVSKNGDLMGNTHLVVTLPKVKEFTTDGQLDNITKFAWARKIGYALINSINIEIGGEIINEHYGEWLNIWSELTQPLYANYERMIGNVSELFDYTNGKDEYTLYVPLQFWFCQSSMLAIPLVALQHADIKINIDFNTFDKCYLIAPTHYIETEQDLVNFTQFEYIEQNINGTIASGRFVYFDPVLKRLYYTKISDNDFQTMKITESDYTPTNRRKLTYNLSNSGYWVKGLESNEFAMPRFNTKVLTHTYNKKDLNATKIKDCYLLIDYIYIDSDEREKFITSRHDYLIEQLQYTGEKPLEGATRNIKIDLKHPCTMLAWVVQLNYYKSTTNNDHFNYTNSYRYSNNKPQGRSLIEQGTVLLNSLERLSFRDYSYYNYVQPYEHFKHNPSEGINVYGFALFPDNIDQPSGSSNMTQLDNIVLKLSLIPEVTLTNPAKARIYALNKNILRINFGLSGLVFAR